MGEKSRSQCNQQVRLPVVSIEIGQSRASWGEEPERNVRTSQGPFEQFPKNHQADQHGSECSSEPLLQPNRESQL